MNKFTVCETRFVKTRAISKKCFLFIVGLKIMPIFAVGLATIRDIIEIIKKRFAFRLL